MGDTLYRAVFSMLVEPPNLPYCVLHQSDFLVRSQNAVARQSVVYARVRDSNPSIKRKDLANSVSYVLTTIAQVRLSIPTLVHQPSADCQ
jgi:hypothetical protein